MDSLYGGDAPPGPSSGVYGSGGGSAENTVDGSRAETSRDAAYYEVTRGGEYGHHYTAEQYEVLSRAIISSDGAMQDSSQSYYSLEPHRPIPIHPSSSLAALASNPLTAALNGVDKRERSNDLSEDVSSVGRGARSSGSESSSFDPDKPELSERDSSIKRKKADQARARYHRMSEEERKEYNLRRRLRQRCMDDAGRPLPPTPTQLSRVQKANVRKARAAREKYHQMSEEEKKEYNLKRTEAFRRKRREEEQLMMSPAMRISQESYDKAQAIMSRNSRKASAARDRYARMSQEERKEYNQRRAESKRKREREQQERKLLLETEEMEGMRHLCEASEVARGLEGYEVTFPKDDEGRAASRQDDDELEHVEVDDDVSLAIPTTSVASTSSVDPLSLPLPALPPTTQTIVDNRAARKAKAGGGAKRSEQTRTAQRIVRAVAEAQYSLENERRRSEYEENWSIHQGSSLGGVLIEDGTRVVYADESSAHIEVGDELHHLQARPSSTGVYEYAEHAMDDHYGEGPDMVQHEVEVPHSPHHGMHHVVHHMDDEIDVVHADDDMMDEWESDAQLLNIADRQYQPRGKRQQLQLLLDHSHSDGGGGGGDTTIQSARLVEQRARRALRSRVRYANMTREEKDRHNAKRANQLRESRKRDLQLLQMDDSEVMMDEELRKMVEAAQVRRNRRAEQARSKYRRMSEEERRQYNAMRDAQRRSRRRDMEGLSDGEEPDEDGDNEEEIRRVRGGRVSTSSAGSSMVGGRGGSSAAAGHHHLQRGGGATTSSHYGYEMYEQDWTGHH